MSEDEGGRETRSRSRSKSPQAGSSNTGNSLYAAGLPLRLNKTEFEELFAKYGRLASCDLIEDPITHESRGFGFVVYEDSRDADDALKALNDKEVYGRRIRVEKSKRSKPHAKSPGQYLGPASASATFRARQRDRSRDRPRDRSRDRRSPPRNRSRDRRDRSPPSRHRSRDRRERSRDRDDRRDDRQRERSRSRDRRR